MEGQTLKPTPVQFGTNQRTPLPLLPPEQLTFELDMCIGCDRCMRACPVPLSNQVNIAELNNATASGEISPLIARFTEECVLCGSCVPVCPVDNHRDRMMLALKQRLGVSWDEEAPLMAIKQVLPQGWNMSRLLLSLRKQAMFQDQQVVPDHYLLHFVAASTLRVVPARTVLLREGEFGREIYFLLDGSCELFSEDGAGHNLPLGILQRGDFVGEQGMLTGQPRNSTVITDRGSVILEVPEQVMQQMIATVSALEHFFLQYNTARAAEELFKRLDLLQDVAPEDLHRLASKASIKYYERDEQLFSEQAQQMVHENLHIILDGFVKVARRTKRPEQPVRIIAYRQRGDYFAGGMDMLGDQRAVTVTAINRVTVAEISRSQLKSLLQAYPDFRMRLQERLQKYRAASTAAYSGVFEPFDRARLEQSIAGITNSLNAISDTEARAGLHALVDDGVVEGTDVLVIDLDKCIHCNECVEACERRHGHSRMNREGVVVGNISVVNACRQCQDPVCMLCSRAGIARTPSGEIYITESCIGCGICAERCPYDNISIVTLDDDSSSASPSTSEPTWQRFSRFFNRSSSSRDVGKKPLPMLQTPPKPGPLQLPGYEDAANVSDPLTEIRKKIAVKCDLCTGYNNQACVQACPTGAAIRVNPVTFFGSTEEILGRRAK